MTSTKPPAEAAVDAFLAAVAHVDATGRVRQAVRAGHLDDWLVDRERPRRIQVLALGKAAPRMLWGLVDTGVPFRGFGVSPPGVPQPTVDTFTWHIGDHPLPTARSFAAGRALLEWMDRLDPDEPLLVLLSGGASACVEVPQDGTSEADLVAAWKEWMADGFPIGELNRRRTDLSALKGGQLAERALAKGLRVRVWLLADTPPELAPEVVGSGPFDHPDVPGLVLADATDLVAGAGSALQADGWSCYQHAERLAGDTEAQVAAFLDAAARVPNDAPVALLGAGETTVTLASRAPRGGRAQHAALLAAKALAQRGWDDAVFLAAGSDGCDGTSDAAGAFVTAADWTSDGEGALAAFDAHGYLSRRGGLVQTGPTGTNVNDLWLLLRPPQA
ncbi:MAG: DUF4147 domain-containing protein [Thermoplasmatota archaeon]